MRHLLESSKMKSCYSRKLSNHSDHPKVKQIVSLLHYQPPDPELYAGLDGIDTAIDGADAAGIIPGIPPIIPIPSPTGNALTPHRQSQLHWPLFIMPVPGTILADGIDEPAVTDMDMAAVVMEPPIVSIARHATSLSLGALMLNRMPRWQWSAWPQ
jgi:hypothetical protein